MVVNHGCRTAHYYLDSFSPSWLIKLDGPVIVKHEMEMIHPRSSRSGTIGHEQTTPSIDAPASLSHLTPMDIWRFPYTSCRRKKKPELGLWMRWLGMRMQTENEWGGLERQWRGKNFPMGRVASSALGHPLCMEEVSWGENTYISWSLVWLSSIGLEG